MQRIRFLGLTLLGALATYLVLTTNVSAEIFPIFMAIIRLLIAVTLTFGPWVFCFYLAYALRVERGGKQLAMNETLRQTQEALDEAVKATRENNASYKEQMDKAMACMTSLMDNYDSMPAASMKKWLDDLQMLVLIMARVQGIETEAMLKVEHDMTEVAMVKTDKKPSSLFPQTVVNAEASSGTKGKAVFGASDIATAEQSSSET